MGLFKELHDMGLWRGYERHVVGLEPVLQGMSRRGMPVNPERYKEVTKRLVDDLATRAGEMQSLIPLAVRTFEPKLGYKHTPKFAPSDPSSSTSPFEVNAPKGTQVYAPREINGEWRWVRLKEWKPSNKALIRYMAYRGHPIPKALKTNKDTSNKDELEKLAKKTGDQLYSKVLQYRTIATILDNHIVNWKPGEDGRVHSTFYFDPATGQLSSRRPNVQNAPKHSGEYATLFRSMVKARPDHSIMEADYKAFHVQTLAFEAQDEVMARMGRLDIHSFVTAHFLKLGEADKLIGMPDDELGDYLKWVKKTHKHTRDAKVKHALLGYNNGMGYKKLYKQYEEYFENEREAKNVLKLLDVLFPKSKKYRDEICDLAHEQGYLISRHGYIRYFFEVFRWQGGKWSHGDDHEAALCFYTQNDAHGELRDRMLTFHERGEDEKWNLLNTIHDSLIWEPHNSLYEECCRVVKLTMEAPSTVLINDMCPNGLSVQVDLTGGPDWVSMK